MEKAVHKKIKKLICNALIKEGYKAEEEHRIGRKFYDVVIWVNNKKVFIEVYTSPPRINFKTPNVKCRVCGYDWFTNSKLEYVSYPSCLQKNRTKIIETIDNTKEEVMVDHGNDNLHEV